MTESLRRCAGYLHLYGRFLKLRLRTYAEHRGDALLLGLSSVLGDGIGLVFLWVTFRSIHSIEGWSGAEVAFVYGLMALGRGVMQCFFDGFWTITSGVYEGRFDIFLSRPVPVLLSVLTFWMSPEGFGQILLGLAMTGAALFHLELSPSPFEAAVALVLVISGIAIRLGLTLIINCVGFWTNGPLPIGDVSEPLYELGRFPLSVYSGPIRLALIAVIPIAFVGVLPATYLLRDTTSARLALAGPLIAVAVWVLALKLFARGLRTYDSTGA